MTHPPEAAGDVADVGSRLPALSSGQLAGPWEQAFWFVAREPVQSKSNHRHGAAARSTWSALKGYSDRIYLAARAARPRGWDPGEASAAVGQRPRIVAVLYARSMLDVGNLSKSILDAVEAPRVARGRVAQSNAAVMVSDAQVAAVVELGERTAQQPGVLVAFARLPAGASTASVALATASLLEQTVALLSP